MIDLAADEAGHVHPEPGRVTERPGVSASTQRAELFTAGGRAPAATSTGRSHGLSAFVLSLALVEVCWVAGIAYVLYLVFA